MRISVIAVGRLRPPYQDDVEHYRKLLAGHARVELIEVREDEQRAAAHPGAGATWCCWPATGASSTRSRFSRWLEERRQDGRDLCFVIGGPRGLDLDGATCGSRSGR